MADKTPTTGGCMCGAVRYAATDDPIRTIHCHCEDCRRHTGAPAATLAVYNADQLEFSGEARTIYASSATAGRAFCPKCGSSLTYEAQLPEYGDVCAIHISSFDDPDAVLPTHHSFYGERISWFDILDELPRYAGFVAGGDLVSTGPSKQDPSR